RERDDRPAHALHEQGAPGGDHPRNHRGRFWRASALGQSMAVATAQHVGKVVQVIGSVLDVQFQPGELLAIYNALKVTILASEGGPASEIVAEVEQHLGENRVRAVAMKPTDGLQRGMEVLDTGAPISVPVGPSTLGRVLNVLGEPVDFPDQPV